MVMLDASVSEVRLRAASFARMQFREHAEKRLQQELDVSEATAERILAGGASRPVIDRMMAKWGWAFAQFVLEPLCGAWSPEPFRDKIDDLERRSAENWQAIQELKREMAGALDGAVSPVARGSLSGASGPSRSAVNALGGPRRAGNDAPVARRAGGRT